jgi:hypothetical protein
MHGRILLALLLAALPGSARADSVVDAIEHYFGASNVHAISGNGRLTIGVSREGDLTVLTWPSPSFTDQLAYLTSNAVEARDLPRLGAEEGMGARVGLVVSTDGGATKEVLWLADAAPDARSIAYSGDDTSVVVVRASYPVGIEVEQRWVIPPDRDTLEIHVRATRREGSAVTDAWLIAYENFSPTLSRVDQLPVADWALEPKNDYAALWDAARGAVLHFRPDDGTIDEVVELVLAPRPSWTALSGVLGAAGPTDEDVGALVDAADETFAPGVYLALSTDPAPDGHQVGYDRTPVCAALDALADNLGALPERLPDLGPLPIDPALLDGLRCTVDPLEDVRDDEGWAHDAEDAWQDAQDGELSGSPAAGAQVNAALRAPLVFDAGSGVAEARVLVGAGATAAEAFAALEGARAEPAEDVLARTEAAAAAYLAPLALPPAEADPDLVAFCKRVLLNIRVGTDVGTGAIVASITRQPPYGEDWPRDGAFFNAALDVAGRPDLVDRHLRFYVPLQRDEPAEPVPFLNPDGPGTPEDPNDPRYPADAWEMNYYADGRTGGNIRFEVDNTALLVWSFVDHAGWTADPTAWLEEVWPTVRRGAELLTRWRDPATGLVWPANEDDSAAFTQGLQGAGTVFLALREAARAAIALGHDDDAARWLERAGELRTAILTHLYDEAEGFVAAPLVENPGSAYGGPAAWIAWPVALLPGDDPRVVAQLQRDLAVMLAHVRGETEGSAYVTKTALAAALTQPDGPDREAALEIATRLARDIAEPDTRQLGEVFLSIDDDGDGRADRFSNRVATPHLWEGALVYLTAMAYYEPARFGWQDDVLPDVTIPEVPLPDSGDAGASPDGGADAGASGPVPHAAGGGCGCRAAGL